MTLGVSARQKMAVSTARKNDIDAAGTSGKMLCYAYPRPANGDPTTSTLLATFDFTDPCGTVDSAGLHLTVSLPAQVVANGIMGWGRLTDGDDNFCIDGDIRMPGDVDVAIADFLVDNSTVYVGGFVVLVSALMAEGG